MIIINRAKDNRDTLRVEEELVHIKDVGGPRGPSRLKWVQRRAEEEFSRIDTFRGNIDSSEYRHWNRLHPGRAGYRPSDWVIYARHRSLPEIAFPFRPKLVGNLGTGHEDDVSLAVRFDSKEEAMRFLESNLSDPEWVFEARSGPEGPHERRMRAGDAVESSSRPKESGRRARRWLRTFPKGGGTRFLATST